MDPALPSNLSISSLQSRECEAERLTHAEALASLASTLGLLLNTTDDQHRAKAVEMCDGIMTDILSTPLPVPRTA